MGTEPVKRYKQRVQMAFVLVAVVLPLQFYVVYTKGSLYPSLFLPPFSMVLDNGSQMFHAKPTLYAVSANGSREAISYQLLFDGLPEYYGRHTLEWMLGDANSTESRTVALDQTTTNWLKQRLGHITPQGNCTALQVEYFNYFIEKQDPARIDSQYLKTITVPLP